MYKFVVTIGFLSALIITTSAQANNYISVGTAVDFSQGYYGAINTTEITATVTQIKYKTQDFSIQLDLPYLFISGMNYLINFNSTVAASTSNSQNTRREGIGDVTLGTTYNVFYSNNYRFAVDMTFKLKVPTASHKESLGTGELDESLQLYTYKGFGDFTLIIGGGYKWLGQPTTTTKYQNIANGTIGLDYQLSTFTSFGSLFDIRQSAFEDLENQTEITVYGTHKFSSSWNSQLYVYKGLTSSSPTFGVGASLNYRF